MKHLLTTLLTSLILIGAAFGSGKHAPEITDSARQQAAIQQLNGSSNQIAVYVKGAICSSCAIGVRKKISKLDFVDRTQFKKGISMDAKTQLILVGVKTGSAPDPALIKKAVADAGYEAPYYFEIIKGKAIRKTIK